MSATDPFEEFLRYARAKLEQNLAQIERCAELLTDAELWLRSNDHANSVGNLVLHLTGNVRQWIVAGIGGQSFARNRPGEFAERGPRPAREIVPPLRQTVQAAVEALSGLDAAALSARRMIQGYDVVVLVALMHVVEHFSFHTGQIVHMTKVLKDTDLSLYDEQGHKLRATADPKLSGLP
jgi:uncharacterized damage-inducible protein DinB